MTDHELELVKTCLWGLDPSGRAFAQVLRATLDQLYDGQRTGRFRWVQLHKTEKTHCGTLVEINLQRRFNFSDGVDLDYTIANVEVDCKYSQTLRGWMIPPEAVGKICLLVWANDDEGVWSAGLIRITEDKLNGGTNRDRKATLSAAGALEIQWLFERQELPPNILLKLDPSVVDQLMKIKSGSQRVCELFRKTLGQRVTRGVVATVARQDDYMKRVRENGGARSLLRPEGIVILGQYNSHRAVATDLGVLVPDAGDFIAVRLVKVNEVDAGVARIDGAYWRVADESDPVEIAPRLPKAN